MRKYKPAITMREFTAAMEDERLRTPEFWAEIAKFNVADHRGEIDRLRALLFTVSHCGCHRESDDIALNCNTGCYWFKADHCAIDGWEPPV